MLLAQISDLHLDGGDYAAGRARRVMDYLHGMSTPPDALLVTGDIADHATVAEYEEAAALLTAGFPILMCPGNHDARAPYLETLLGEPASDAPVNRAHRVGDLAVLMCDSSIPGRSEGRLAEETLAWIESTVDDSPTVLAMHHFPVRVHQPYIDHIGLRNPEDLAALLERHRNIIAVLVGHAHIAASTVFAGRPLVIAPSVTYAMRLPWEDDQPGDRGQPPGTAFHFIEDADVFTRFKTVVEPWS